MDEHESCAIPSMAVRELLSGAAVDTLDLTLLSGEASMMLAIAPLMVEYSPSWGVMATVRINGFGNCVVFCQSNSILLSSIATTTRLSDCEPTFGGIMVTISPLVTSDGLNENM